jgi:hypothetical protein
MTHILRVTLAVPPALAVLLGGVATAHQVPKSATDCPESDRVQYSPAPPEALRDVDVSSLDMAAFKQAVQGLDPQKSPHGTVSYFIRAPDFMKRGPWTTTVYVMGNEVRPVRLAVRFSSHANGGVRASWINEKLIALQVWRGRIASTDLILDVDTQQFIYQEAANYGILIQPCDSRRLEKLLP